MDPPLIGGLPSRDSESLDGAWQILPDPYDQGRFDFLSRPRRDGFWNDRKPANETERVEYAFNEEHTLNVPGDWNTQDERFFFYENPIWYKRSFVHAPNPDRPRTFLRFGAANKVADVWLNGVKLGTHEVGFTPFEFEVTDAIKEGENTLVVRVDNTRRVDGVPAMVTDWWNYGGLTRSVHLIRTTETFVRDAHAELSPNDTITGWFQLDGPRNAGTPVSITVGSQRIETTTGNDGTANFEMPRGSLALWSPSSPALHEFEVASANDTMRDRIGLRTIATDGPSILLNGERVFLRGICIHEESLSTPGRAAGEADARELLGLAKELGCNYVRLAHYTHDESMTRVADELGLMVWAEIPVYWVMQYTNDRTLWLAKTHLQEMIARDHNRASVVIWSVGNETGDDPDTTAFRVKLGEYVKELDPSRLLSAAMFARQLKSDGKLARMRVDDPFGAIADVLAINQYVGWYHDQPESMQGVELELAWNKPFLISETGAGIQAGLRGAPTAVWTEDFGLRYYEAHLGWCDELRDAAALNHAPHFSGISPWILKDFLSPRRPLYGVQDWFNRKGLVDQVGRKKMVFGLVQETYRRWAQEDQ